MSSYGQLIQKLDAFIRKYYKNQLLKGVIYAVALGLSLFLVVTAAEYFGRFSTPVRGVFFFGFSAALVFILGKYIVLPASGLFRLGKTITHEQAAQIVGTHFSDVKDKLLNTLQLKKMADGMGGNEMLEAAISQKTAELKPVPFTHAVNFSDNKKYLKFAVIPLLVLLSVAFAAPGVITDGTKRVVNYNKEYKPEAPFTFNIEQELSAAENDDLPITVTLTGQEIPQNVYIEYGGARFRMGTEGKTKFSHTIKKVSKDFSFHFFSDGFYSEDYKVSVVPKPALAGMKIRLDYPSYLNRTSEVLTGTGDMTIPEGTQINWTINTKNTDELGILLGDSVLTYSPKENKVIFRRKAKRSFSYAVTGKNKYMPQSDTNRYSVAVVADTYPAIAVEETQDSTYRTLYYFRGEITDDYGFKGLTFHYKKQTEDSEEKEAGYTLKSIGVNSSQVRQTFFYAINFAEAGLVPGDEIVYFFTVYDNDGVNGSKSTRTAKRVFKVPTEEELAAENQRMAESVKSDLSESVKKAKEIQKETNELNKSLLQKKNMDWQDQKKVQELLKKQKELEKNLKDLIKENERKNQLQNQFKQPDEQQLERQKEMEKLLKDMMNEELQKLLEEMEKMMQQQDKNKLQEQLKDMKNNNEDLQKELERMLELYKQMEFDMKLQETIDKLDKTAQEQKDLAKQSAKEDGQDAKKQEAIEKKQEELNKKFDEVRKDIEDLHKKNEELENKREEFKDTKKEEEQIQKDQDKASENLKNQQNKKASESQKDAGEKMEQMSNELKDMQAEMEENQEAEDLEALRRVLDNLMRLSFDQEDLMENLRRTNKNSPKYKELAQIQRKLKDDGKIIEDSLFALSKRVPQIAATVNQEIADIRRNMDDAVQDMSDRETVKALTEQQYAMTSINNLALLISEAIENAQASMQMKSNSQGNKSCKKPGSSGKPSPGEMKKLQEAQQKLSEQMRKMAQQMQGKQQGNNKPGEQNGQGQSGSQGEMSKDLAKMAAEQEMIRKQMQEMMDRLGDNNQRKMLQELMKKMEDNETDLYNKRINQQTLMRQKEIEIKMLDSEKALREQEQDEQRESQEGNTPNVNDIQQYQKYLQQKQKETELLRTVPPALKPYYKQKVSEYFNRI